MPRTASFTADDLTERALMQFWADGFHATSMDALVRATGVSRHGIYTAFGGKKGLFQACFPKYQELVVTPAFAVMEQDGADLSSVAAYFDTQISAAEAAGLPGLGCFVANTATEVAPHDTAARDEVAAHNARLHAGFRNVFQTVAAPDALDDLATWCVVFTNGLWSTSRVTDDGAVLRRAVAVMLTQVAGQLS